VKLRLFEKALIRNPVRRYIQEKFEAPRLFRGMPRLNDGICLELGSGYGDGALLIRKHTRCRRVIATDIDPAMAR
jgi:hypothetical protein